MFQGVQPKTWLIASTENCMSGEIFFTSGRPSQELLDPSVAHTTRNDSLAACER
jgi:hypothetical protein